MVSRLYDRMIFCFLGRMRVSGRKSRFCSLLFGIALICFLAVPYATAQVQNASLTGLVTDSSGAALPDATVTVKNTDTNIVMTQRTDAVGYYLFAALPIGT